MTGRPRRFSLVSKILGTAAVFSAAALIAAGSISGAPGPVAGSSSYKSVAPETMIGGITPEEYAANQAALHAWLMQEMPAGVLNSPIRVSLTDTERNELKKMQEARGGPAVVGRTKPISEAVRFTGIDAALLSDNPRPVGRGLLRATPDGGFVWAAAIVSEGAAAIRVQIKGLNLPDDAGRRGFEVDDRDGVGRRVLHHRGDAVHVQHLVVVAGDRDLRAGDGGEARDRGQDETEREGSALVSRHWLPPEGRIIAHPPDVVGWRHFAAGEDSMRRSPRGAREDDRRCRRMSRARRPCSRAVKGSAMPTRVALLVLALGVVAVAGRAHAQGVLDFVTFDGVDYIRWTEEPGRTLVRSDLGIEFATVECSIGEDRRGCPFGVDAAAAFMPAGTKMYAVRGYRTDFRLAAVWKDRIFLYQAWRNARAKVGGDLYDIAGKVRRIDVQRGEPTPAAPGIPVTITSLRDAEALVDMIVRGVMRQPRAHAFGEPRYWLTFWLADGTTLGRPYFAETSELLGGLVVPDEVRRILERYLSDS